MFKGKKDPAQDGTGSVEQDCTDGEERRSRIRWSDPYKCSDFLDARKQAHLCRTAQGHHAAPAIIRPAQPGSATIALCVRVQPCIHLGNSPAAHVGHSDGAKAPNLFKTYSIDHALKVGLDTIGAGSQPIWISHPTGLGSTVGHFSARIHERETPTGIHWPCASTPLRLGSRIVPGTPSSLEGKLTATLDWGSGYKSCDEYPKAVAHLAESN
jgi:hypothetical protein